jgi:hypothetical protein
MSAVVSKRYMSTTFIDGLPDVSDDADLLSVRARGLSAFVYAPRFLARFSLTSGNVKWVVERKPITNHKSTCELPRRIEVFGRNVVCNVVGDALAEILPIEDGAVVVESRHVETGELLWEHSIPIPRAAAWAEKKPAWPGGPTEEIHAFLADDPKHLVVCLFRETRRSMLSWPSKVPEHDAFVAKFCIKMGGVPSILWRTLRVASRFGASCLTLSKAASNGRI